MTAPGQLNRRLALEAPIEVDDGAGGVVRSYQEATMLWAQVVPLAASADVNADALAATRRFRIVIRHRDDVTVRHRLREGTRFYRVTAVQESADRRFLALTAETRGD